MLQNRVRERWAEGRPAVNAWLSIGSAFTAEIMAEAGYDALTLDLQHGVISFDAAVAMLQAMRASGAAVLARVSWLDPAAIMRALDAGAAGVICPMIDNAEQAARLVAMTRYPPTGMRSYGPTRASVAAGGEYGFEADDHVLTFAMIETAAAYADLDRIVATPGLDGVYVGPADLTIALTGRRYPIGIDREEPEMIDAIQRVLAASHAAGIRAGLHCGSPSYAARGVEWGFDLVTVSSDARLLSTAAAASVSALRGQIDVTTVRDSAGPRVAY